MIRDEYLRRLVDAAYVDVYLSATDGARLYWPWRMMPVHEADKRHRNACERFIVDSSFQDESITNEDVLDMGETLDAEAVVLADVWHDVDATVDALVDGINMYDDHPFDGDVLLPLQPPHAECYRRLISRGVSVDHIFAVGGVKDKPDSVKLDAAKQLRDVAGPDVHIHGLGYGVTDTTVRGIRQNPDLLDSIDYSTPMQSGLDGTVAPGDERMSVAAMRAASQLVEDLRLVSPFVTVDEDTEQVGLNDIFAATDAGNDQSLQPETDTEAHE